MGKSNGAWEKANATQLFVILADDVADQIVETPQQAKKEKADLEKMGFTVRLIIVREPTLEASWKRAEELMEKHA